MFWGVAFEGMFIPIRFCRIRKTQYIADVFMRYKRLTPIHLTFSSLKFGFSHERVHLIGFINTHAATGVTEVLTMTVA